MLRLLLLRHAKSDQVTGLDDRDRPLAEVGRADSIAMGQFMARQGLLPALVLVSAALRTQQTWALVAPAFSATMVERLEPRLYNASAQSILTLLQETDADFSSLLVIAHNPGLSQLAQRLCGAGDPGAIARLRDGLPTTGLVAIDFALDHWSQLGDGLGTLSRFATPKSIN